jgi:hypothetical protein
MDKYLTRKEQLHHEVDRSGKIEALRRSEGWLYVKTHLDEVLEVIKLHLTVSEGDKETIRLQERFNAFSTVIKLIEGNKNLHDTFVTELNELISDEKFDDEFGLTQ